MDIAHRELMVGEAFAMRKRWSQGEVVMANGQKIQKNLSMAIRNTWSDENYHEHMSKSRNISKRRRGGARYG